MKYQDNTSIKIGDELKVKETKKAYIKISLSENMDNVPTNNISISNIFGQIIYEQYKVGDTDITDEIIKTYKIGDMVYYNPETGEKDCSNYTKSNSLNENKIGCMKWYVIANNDETLNLILDHNTTYNVAWNSSGNNSAGAVTANEKLKSDVSSWTSEAKNTARMITADEIYNITSSTNGVSSWNSLTSTSGFYFEGGQKTGVGTSKYKWLFNYAAICTNYGCEELDNGTFGYWTSSTLVGNSSFAWRIDCDGKLYEYGITSTNYGIRPVITITK